LPRSIPSTETVAIVPLLVRLIRHRQRCRRRGGPFHNHVSIDRAHGLIRTWATTDASRHDGAQLPNLVDKTNTASDVWADTAYRSAKNEKHLANNGLRSQIHRKKPQGNRCPKPWRGPTARSRRFAPTSNMSSRQQKGPMDLVIRTIGLARAKVKIRLANLIYNMKRAVWLAHRTAAA
jgi:transposase, IS5 family